MSTDRAMEKFFKLPLLGQQTRGVKLFLKIDVSLHVSVDFRAVNGKSNTERSQSRMLVK